MAQALDTFIEFDKDAKRSVTRHSSLDGVANLVGIEELDPRIGLTLANPE